MQCIGLSGGYSGRTRPPQAPSRRLFHSNFATELKIGNILFLIQRVRNFTYFCKLQWSSRSSLLRQTMLFFTCGIPISGYKAKPHLQLKLVPQPCKRGTNNTVWQRCFWGVVWYILKHLITLKNWRGSWRLWGRWMGWLWAPLPRSPPPPRQIQCAGCQATAGKSRPTAIWGGRDCIHHCISPPNLLNLCCKRAGLLPSGKAGGARGRSSGCSG